MQTGKTEELTDQNWYVLHHFIYEHKDGGISNMVWCAVQQTAHYSYNVNSKNVKETSGFSVHNTPSLIKGNNSITPIINQGEQLYQNQHNKIMS